ncbi:MAG: type II secretion system protein GspM [Pseudomonadota bacterium]|nr:type II secretion system protein GspM [Pseudomonadota bacterium]
MKLGNVIQTRLAPLQQAIDRLPSRDRKALLLLAVFLLVMLLGSVVWLTHRAANTATQSALEARELLGWMRAQAPNIRATAQNTQPLTQLVQQAASQQGLIVTQNGDDQVLQVSVQHQSFAVLGAWLSRLAADGVQIRQLDIRQQPDGQLQLQATLSLGGASVG